MKKQRFFFPDLLRVVAAFLVVLIHVTSVGIHDGAVGSVLWCICTSLFIFLLSAWVAGLMLRLPLTKKLV